MIETATARSQVYALLSLIYREEPTKELLSDLGSPELRAELSRCGIEFELAEGGDAALREEIAVEYSRLFLVPGPERVSPFESVHAETGLKELVGPEAIDVNKFIEAIGLKLEKGPLLSDHVAVEFEIMRKLTEAESEASASGDKGKVKDYQKAQRLFLEKHLARWFPQFAEGVKKASPKPFYGDTTAFAAEFIKTDLDSLPGSIFQSENEPEGR